MSAVTRERVEELLRCYKPHPSDGADAWSRLKEVRDIATALTRLLALEDALARARPGIEQYVRQLSEDNDGNYVWLQWRDDAIKALEALAALGGGK